MNPRRRTILSWAAALLLASVPAIPTLSGPGSIIGTGHDLSGRGFGTNESSS